MMAIGYCRSIVPSAIAGTSDSAKTGSASGLRATIAGTRLIKARSTPPATIQAEATVGAFRIKSKGDPPLENSAFGSCLRSL